MTTFNVSLDHTTLKPQQIADVYNSVHFTVPDTFLQRTDFMETMYCPGTKGVFVFVGDKLIGAARVFSDNAICTWIAEICVMPQWQGKGVGSKIVQAILDLFRHTSIYMETFSGQETFFERFGIKPRAQLTACSKAPHRD